MAAIVGSAPPSFALGIATDDDLPVVDRETFQKRALEHLDAVWRMAVQLSRNDADAADLVQETYLRALRAADRFEERAGGMRAWLFRILHNVFFTEVERRGRRPTPTESMANYEVHGGRPEDPVVPWDLASFDWEHVDERLKAAIDGLRPEYRVVLLLWAVEGLRYREIAEITEVPIGTVMSRLHRARGILMEQLAGFREQSGAADD